MIQEKFQLEDPIAIKFFKTYLKKEAFSDDEFLSYFEKLCQHVRERALQVNPYK
jgi:hypothetical protein